MTELNNKTISASRVSANFDIRIHAAADDVFALACPKEELKWIDHWQYEMIYSDSGKNETNCIFEEKMSGLFVLNMPGMETFWYTTLYDRQTRRFHALLIYGNAGAGKFEFEVADSGNGESVAYWRLLFTALNENGSRLADDGLKGRMNGMLQFLGKSAKHYLETGNMLKVG